MVIGINLKRFYTCTIGSLLNMHILNDIQIDYIEQSFNEFLSNTGCHKA